jgi:hypothetical protein
MASFDGEQRCKMVISKACVLFHRAMLLQGTLGLREPRAATGGDRQQTVRNQPIDQDVALNLLASELIVN